MLVLLVVSNGRASSDHLRRWTQLPCTSKGTFKWIPLFDYTCRSSSVDNTSMPIISQFILYAFTIIFWFYYVRFQMKSKRRLICLKNRYTSFMPLWTISQCFSRGISKRHIFKFIRCQCLKVSEHTWLKSLMYSFRFCSIQICFEKCFEFFCFIFRGKRKLKVLNWMFFLQQMIFVILCLPEYRIFMSNYPMDINCIRRLSKIFLFS